VPAELPLQIDARGLADRLQTAEPPMVLDVREPWEVAICAIPDSVNVPMAEIAARIDDLPQERSIVVVCHHGMRSLQVTGFLRSRGFDLAQNLAGGVDSWAQEVDFAMPRY
jgi:rhodanese-related sulfurtransferase